MHNNKNLVWIASYPKSGNTWMRVFLSNVLSDSGEPVHINHLMNTPIASSRAIFEEACGISPSDLPENEIERLRPAVYRYLAEQSNEKLFLKIHDALIKNENGEQIIPRELTRGAIYIVRNPLDVSISFSHHLGKPVDRVIDLMNDPDYALSSAPDRLTLQLKQRLLTWSMHVKSWTHHDVFPVLVLKYEDMLLNPFETFNKAAKFAGLNRSEKEIERAVSNSSFKLLQDQELKNGFKERNNKTGFFFRKGEIDQWKNLLSKEEIRKVITYHYNVMSELGYVKNIMY